MERSSYPESYGNGRVIQIDDGRVYNAHRE